MHIKDFYIFVCTLHYIKQDSKTVMNLGPPTIIHFDVKTLWIYIYNYIAKHWGDQRTMDFTNGRDLM